MVTFAFLPNHVFTTAFVFLCRQNHDCQIYLGEMFSLFVNCGLLSHTFEVWSLVGSVSPWLARNPKKKKKKKKAFNHLKPTCNSLAWNLEAASHDKFPLHNNGLQLLWIKYLPYLSKKKKHKIWYFILRKDFPNPNHH